MRILVLASGFVAIGAALLYRQELASSQNSALAEIGQAVDEGASMIANTVKSIGYSYDKVPSQYRYAIGMAERQNGLPDQLLARLLYQESRYRPDIISGATVSPAGALGIAQFMPATAKEWQVNALDAFSSINGAGRYLAWLYKQTGSWDRALAAYNWGVGNVRKKGIANAPQETRNYFSQIMADIGLA